MIKRVIEIIYGNNLINTTPLTCDISKCGEASTGFGLSLKNITDADCVGDIKLIFLDDKAYEFFLRKLAEAKAMKDQEVLTAK